MGFCYNSTRGRQLEDSRNQHPSSDLLLRVTLLMASRDCVAIKNTRWGCWCQPGGSFPSRMLKKEKSQL